METVVANLESQESIFDADKSLRVSDDASNLKHKLDVNHDQSYHEDGSAEKKQKLNEIPTASELRKVQREEERKAKKEKKEKDEERKRDEKRLKKQEEIERRRIKKEQEELERKQKRESIEAEKKAKRDQKEQERLAKLRKKEAEQKAREEKKKLEEEEKARKKEELERKKQQKLKEKEEKASEKKRLEDEKKKDDEERKKKRSITNFFKVKHTPQNDIDETNNNTSGDSSPIKLNSDITKAKSNEVETEPIISEFDQFFLPFYIQGNVTVTNTIKEKSSKWDSFINNPSAFTYEQPKSQEPRIPIKTSKASYVLQLLNTGMQKDAEFAFNNIPLRYLRFYENKKPPYFGTYSTTVLDIREVDILKHPFTKLESVNIDYEYDSDYSDGEDEDGEDVEEDDDEEEEDDDNEEMGSSDIEGFVETDESNPVNGKRAIMGPLVPLVRNINEAYEPDNEFSGYFQTLSWDLMQRNIKFPIDPFENYWKSSSNDTTVEQTINVKGQEGETDIKQIPVEKGPMIVKKKVISDEKVVEALLNFVKANNSLSINTLAELATKQVPELAKSSRALVKNTIKEVARFDKKSTLWVPI